ncbi:MAG: rhombosortase [Deltaproteobacteria bacterium]|nr:MAG: rhombosortase [Deltaproteobacteria bacterium]
MAQILLSKQASSVWAIRKCLHTIKAKFVANRPGTDTLILLFLVMGLNIHLLGVGSGYSTIFVPSAVRAGEWWRLFTHPFVHATWYHLILDAGAFFILYAELNNRSVLSRILCISICAGAGLAAGIFFSPLMEVQGLCGLSGTAHGLMAYSGLATMKEGKHGWMGFISFLLVVAKSIYELFTGVVFFDFLHMGLCGTPVAACHFGGVSGGIVSFVILARKRP